MVTGMLVGKRYLYFRLIVLGVVTQSPKLGACVKNIQPPIKEIVRITNERL